MPTTPDPRDDYLPEDDEDLTMDRPPNSFMEAVQESPLVAVAAAFVAGLVVSRMIL